MELGRIGQEKDHSRCTLSLFFSFYFFSIYLLLEERKGKKEEKSWRRKAEMFLQFMLIQVKRKNIFS